MGNNGEENESETVEELENELDEEFIELEIFEKKVGIFSDFLKEQKINLSKWFEGIISRSQTKFEASMKTSKLQFVLTIIFLFLISGGLLTALLLDKIVAETFIGIIGIVIGYMFYMLKYSAISQIKKGEQI